jgi:hypothetical protein
MLCELMLTLNRVIQFIAEPTTTETTTTSTVVPVVTSTQTDTTQLKPKPTFKDKNSYA